MRRPGGGGRGRRVRSAARAALPLAALAIAACGTNPAPVRVTLPPGSSFAAVTDSLAAHGVVSSRFAFKALARLRGADRAVRAGIYEFPAEASPWQVLDMLEAGSAVGQKFTVPEGLTIPEIAALAEARLGLPADSFAAAARDSALADSLGIGGGSLEGFLRPETYSLPLGITARDLARVMAEGFLAAWRPEWTARLDSLKLTRRQLVTLASIVEGEARVDEERETIAAVYHNRLRIGMPLQADPTVQYAIAERTGRRKPRLFEKDYLTRSPYNTYLHPGLPPGPVNSPSLRSIEATLYPADAPYLYFVAGPDGRHLFSRTYGEHLRAIAKLRRGRR